MKDCSSIYLAKMKLTRFDCLERTICWNLLIPLFETEATLPSNESFIANLFHAKQPAFIAKWMVFHFPYVAVFFSLYILNANEFLCFQENGLLIFGSHATIFMRFIDPRCKSAPGARLKPQEGHLLLLQKFPKNRFSSTPIKNPNIISEF